jgi:hypothetical protein
LHDGLPNAADEIPWTISYVMKKRMQIDGFNELPKEKRPPDNMIWYGDSDEIDKWFDKVFKRKQNPDEDVTLYIDPSEIE